MLLKTKKAKNAEDNAMKKALLIYFTEPKKSTHMKDDFPDFDFPALRKMYLALIRTGMIANITARKTQGAVYMTTRIGQEVLKGLS